MPLSVKNSLYIFIIKPNHLLLLYPDAFIKTASRARINALLLRWFLCRIFTEDRLKKAMLNTLPFEQSALKGRVLHLLRRRAGTTGDYHHLTVRAVAETMNSVGLSPEPQLNKRKANSFGTRWHFGNLLWISSDYGLIRQQGKTFTVSCLHCHRRWFSLQ